jgi:parvulin-like peptidyl-prolyl isomerase
LKKLVSILMVTAFAVSACGGGSSAVAATVNGTDITVGDVEALIDPGTDSTIAKDNFAQFLGFEIQWQVVIDAANDEFGISISDDEISAEADQLFADNATEGQSREDFLSSNMVTEEFLQSVAHQQLLDAKVREVLAPDVAEPTQEEIDARRDLAAMGLAEVCVSHILVATEEEANAVLDRLDAGEDFGDLAAELSLDTGSGADGGVLECSAPSRFVPEFADAAMTAEIGQVTGPVETQYGFHILIVNDRTEADPADLPSDDELVATLTEEAITTATNDWFVAKVEAADVTVDEQYGTWQANPPQVIPPTG